MPSEYLRDSSAQVYYRKMCFGSLVKLCNPFHEAERSYRKAEESFKSYQNSGTKDVLLEAITHYRNAYERSDQSYKKFSIIVINYASALDEYDINFGEHREYPNAITLLNNAKQAMLQKQSPVSDSYLEILNYLGNAHLIRYQKTKDRDDFQAAIDTFKEVRSLSSRDSSAFASSLIGSATAISTACELQPQEGDIQLLQEAVKHLEEALEIRQDSKIECFRCLALGHDILYRQKPATNRENLDKAIQYNSEVVNFLELNSEASGLARTYFNLAKQQFERHIATKDAKDLADAKKNNEKASSSKVQDPVFRELVDKLNKNIELYEKRGKTTVDSFGSSNTDAALSHWPDLAQEGNPVIRGSHPYAYEVLCNE